eukprot:486829-Hanusia_phi.AAC.3
MSIGDFGGVRGKVGHCHSFQERRAQISLQGIERVSLAIVWVRGRNCRREMGAREQRKMSDSVSCDYPVCDKV